MTDATPPPAKPAEAEPLRQSSFVRDLRLVVMTVGFTSLAWLIVGGFFIGWLWDRPQQPAQTIAAGSADEDLPAMVMPVSPQDEEAAQGLVEQSRGPGASLAVPVAGVRPAELTDTYTDSRAGGARSHDAIDIMAATGTPVLAAAPGTVEKLFVSDAGGNTVYVRSADGKWIYYYAHLQAWAPDLAEGQVVRVGDRLGTVGSTGNADPSAPHLHFAVMRMAADDDWYEGAAINPYPLLTGGQAR